LSGLRIGVDIGGTFTDLVAIGADGGVRTHKTASTPQDYSVGIESGLRALLGGAAVDEVLHATTIGSNAVLEGRGARTALITSRGFRDVLEIRDLRMPRLYDIGWTKPTALVERRLRLEVGGRIGPDGGERAALEMEDVEAAIRLIGAEGVASVAVCLLHSYANPAHEQAVVAAVEAALPGVAVTASYRLLPEIKEYPRTSTTVVNAYLQPVVRAYLVALEARLRALGITCGLRLMQSNGGLASAAQAAAFPAHIVESGPAAGVVGAAVLAAHLGEKLVVTFDMGGTTAKAGLVEAGEVLRTEAMEVGGGVMAGARLLVGAGYMLKLPAVDLAEVGAGGGSICRIDEGGAPKVGPQSAGADPGPVCYGRGGVEPTITDCGVVLGYIDPAGLAGGALALDAGAARAAVAERLAGPLRLAVEQAAHGMLQLASAVMMRAIRAVSVERGRDIRQAALLAFGGNGPLFAAWMARGLGISRVIVPPMPGLFSAFGLLLADTEHHATRSLRMRLDGADLGAVQAALDELVAAGRGHLAADGFPVERQRLMLSAMARYIGQSCELVVPVAGLDAAALLGGLAEAFGVEHQRSYGFRAGAEEPVELMGLSLVARGVAERARLPEAVAPAVAAGPRLRQAWFAGVGWVATPVCDRAALAVGTRVGPLIVQEYDATCLVPPGVRAAVDGFGNIVLEV
jgi:N-methylhydantoinase A